MATQNTDTKNCFSGCITFSRYCYDDEYKRRIVLTENNFVNLRFKNVLSITFKMNSSSCQQVDHCHTFYFMQGMC